MSPQRMFRGRARWTSAAAILVVAGVLTGTLLANAAGPGLPRRTPAQLLAAMRTATPPTAMTAVVTENANLGFPSLPDIAGLQSPLLSAAGLISGTHTVDIWYNGPRHVRIALPVSFGETDLRVNGNQVWLWASHGQTATHYILPAMTSLPVFRAMPTPARIKSIKAAPFKALPRCFHAMRLAGATGKALQARIIKCFKSLKLSHGMPIAIRPETPIQAADQLLAAVGPSTKVTVAGSTVVAGRSAYQLSIAPRTNQSLISQILIAVDSQTYLPLQLQVFARGMSSPAFQIGFTSLTFGAPAASNFTFTPPPGAHVKTEKLAQSLPSAFAPFALGGMRALPAGPFTGQRWLGGAYQTPAKLGAAQKKGLLRVAIGAVKWKVSVGKVSAVPVQGYASAVVHGPSQFAGLPGAALSGVKVLGSGWLSVAVIPAGNALPAAPAPAKAGSRPLAIGGPGQAGQLLSVLRVLLNSAARVHGSWGSGRLLSTSLFSVLITNNGKVLIGAVTPAVLYADAAKVK